MAVLPTRFATVRSRLAAVLAVLLLAAELVAVTHPLDAAAHAADEPCKICLGIASFGSAAVAHEPVFLLEPPAVAPAVAVVALPSAERAQPYHARAPPSAS